MSQQDADSQRVTEFTGKTSTSEEHQTVKHQPDVHVLPLQTGSDSQLHSREKAEEPCVNILVNTVIPRTITVQPSNQRADPADR